MYCLDTYVLGIHLMTQSKLVAYNQKLNPLLIFNLLIQTKHKNMFYLIVVNL